MLKRKRFNEFTILIILADILSNFRALKSALWILMNQIWLLKIINLEQFIKFLISSHRMKQFHSQIQTYSFSTSFQVRPFFNSIEPYKKISSYCWSTSSTIFKLINYLELFKPISKTTFEKMVTKYQSNKKIILFISYPIINQLLSLSTLKIGTRFNLNSFSFPFSQRTIFYLLLHPSWES